MEQQDDLQPDDPNAEGACDNNPFPHAKGKHLFGTIPDCVNWTPESHGKRLNRRLRELGLLR